MDIGMCRELIELAECLNFHKAANRLFITQSTLSKHVSAVERELGIRIFERNTQKVELTESGNILVAGLKQMVEVYDRTLQQAFDHQRGADAIVRIVGPLLNSEIASLVSSAVSLIAQNQPIEVVMTDTGVRDTEERLLLGNADIAIGFRYAETSSQLFYEHLFDIPFGVACHAAHPLATVTPLTFANLTRARIISYPAEERIAYHNYVSRVKERHNIHTPIEHLKSDTLCFPGTTDSVIFGIHFPDYSRFGADIVTRQLDDTSDVFDTCVICRKHESNPAVLALFNAIVTCAQHEQR